MKQACFSGMKKQVNFLGIMTRIWGTRPFPRLQRMEQRNKCLRTGNQNK